MPELPEVQTIVNQLKENLVGKTITGIDIRLSKLWSGNKEQIIGSKILDVRRRAKMIIIKLDHGRNLVVHLKMTGQLIYSDISNNSNNRETVTFPNPIPFAGTTLPGKTTHIIFQLSGGVLFFNDMRQFGWVKVLTDDELVEVSEKHGPEPFSDEFTLEYLEKILSNWGRPVKLLLLDQSKISGIGNIYANEALWCAGISPMKRGKEVEKEKIKKLYACIKSVLEEGLKYHGSSAGDEAYVDVAGNPGKMQEHFKVYSRTGQPCPNNCGGKVVRGEIGGRGTFFCPKCQK
ncbi:bifunctional DNA-formamidopyrimidine glycosylase/DNA-(apurinic or apyrimidinic site) lyase [Patescibacteria group bacterium]|nr:bifunctional DNA-formamidopyrimidine glycosylase/DNA-(apurinic or apyrimidinic site) lyase [Patescibacteria group bacterium]